MGTVLSVVSHSCLLLSGVFLKLLWLASHDQLVLGTDHLSIDA